MGWIMVNLMWKWSPKRRSHSEQVCACSCGSTQETSGIPNIPELLHGFQPHPFLMLSFLQLSPELVKSISVQRPRIQTRICLDTGENVCTKWPGPPEAEIRM